MERDRVISSKAEDRIAEALIRAIRVLPEDVESLIRRAAVAEHGQAGRLALGAILENIDEARRSGLPLCQDTGMFWCLASVGRESSVPLCRVEEAIIAGAGRAAAEGYYRKSVVEDPVYSRRNTGTNLPAVISYELADGSDVTLHFLFKGFGSENCSSLRMINPTAGEDGVSAAVLDMMMKAGGKPCPPVFLGIGIGGTMDRAAFLSKKAFFKEPEDSPLRRRLMDEVNGLGIGPGGLGGSQTVLDISIISEPTHIAGLPVALTVNCWADRKCSIVFKEGEL